MIEFYSFSGGSLIFISFVLGICVLAQTLALILSFYSHSLLKIRIFENLLELSILAEILIFSLLNGQLINAYKLGLVAPSGYDNRRIFIFILILVLGIIVSYINKNLMPLIVIPASMISLPIMEDIIGKAYPWFFIASIIFFLARSIKICISSALTIRTSLSALSVINALDTLHTGVLFSEKDGYILLSNKKMRSLMITITGKIFRNSLQFYDTLESDGYDTRYEKVELDDQMVYLLTDGTAWMFTKKDIFFRRKKYVHISATDVSKQWELTSTLQNKNQELEHKRNELKDTIANLHILSKEKEIENAKMRAHDVLGQRLSLLLRVIQDKDILDYDLLSSLSKGLLAELKAEQIGPSPYGELKNIQELFANIGVDIIFAGQLPDDIKQARLFVDIIREASTNAVRHGLATQVNIKAEIMDNIHNLTINNNGYTKIDPITPGSGIGVIRKKVRAQGGILNISHYPLFTLSVDLPGGDPYEESAYCR